MNIVKSTANSESTIKHIFPVPLNGPRMWKMVGGSWKMNILFMISSYNILRMFTFYVLRYKDPVMIINGEDPSVEEPVMHLYIRPIQGLQNKLILVSVNVIFSFI